MRALLLGSTCLLLSATLSAQTSTGRPADGTLLRREPYALPPFDRLTAEQRAELIGYATAAEYEATRNDAGFNFAKLAYASDGLRVIAYA